MVHCMPLRPLREQPLARHHCVTFLFIVSSENKSFKIMLQFAGSILLFICAICVYNLVFKLELLHWL